MPENTIWSIRLYNSMHSEMHLSDAFGDSSPQKRARKFVFSTSGL